MFPSGDAGRPGFTTLNAGSGGSTGVGPTLTGPGRGAGRLSSEQRIPPTPKPLVPGIAAQDDSFQTKRRLTRHLER